MKDTFKGDECMVITIALGSLREEGQLMPENFHCVFKDVYKVFLKCQPKALGAAQLIAGVLVISLGLLLHDSRPFIVVYTMPSLLFVGSGMVTYAAGHSPNMSVAKVSFSLNIISFFWAIVAVVLCALYAYYSHYDNVKVNSLNAYYSRYDNVKVVDGILGLIAALLVTEMNVALFLIYWQSEAVCRQHFNLLVVLFLYGCSPVEAGDFQN